VTYFTASCDSVETNKKFAASLKLDYPILSDPKCETAKKYGVASAARKFPRRVTFYIDPNLKIVAIDKQVKAGSHGQDIVKQLETLDVPKR